MARAIDGPGSAQFRPLELKGNASFARLAEAGVSPSMCRAVEHAPRGRCVCWGIPFKVARAVVLNRRPVTVNLGRLKAPWLVFMHTADAKPPQTNEDGFIVSSGGVGRAGELTADYVFIYADGTEQRIAIRRAHQISAFTGPWGVNCAEAVGHCKPRPQKFHGTETIALAGWGHCQTRAAAADGGPWRNWLWAWRNPHPGKAVAAIRFEPADGAVVVSAITAGRCSAPPLRWLSRRKAVLTLPRGASLDPRVDEAGLFKQVQLDMGQVISVEPRRIYPRKDWPRSYNNALPDLAEREIVVEYAAHPDARFHFPNGRTAPVAKLRSPAKVGPLRRVASAEQRVNLRVIDKRSRKPLAVKLHLHGEAGEYLAPEDRHRCPNPHWFQDYSVDFSHLGVHHCTYIDGATTVKLPLGRVYLEVSKGFEIRPVRKVVRVTRATREIIVEIENVLPWRRRRWVTADTHVHFLSPSSALLEGAAEGVNVVNLLASQWGELMTNVGDFDGRTTFGSKAAGGDGEYLVRVGTENRQHVLGHISLLGYRGPIIGPMTTGGADESAIGDPVEVLLTEWARQCRRQGGVVIIPHFPNPRLENAATIASGAADAVEMTSWGFLYNGIDPYSLSDWYRYLNCGYMVAAVGGTDKMSSTTAVGTVRTYARIAKDEEFTYEAWKAAIRRGDTFVTYGPLMEFAVEGAAPGSRIKMSGTGGTVDVAWNVASVTVPMSRVDLVVNGEIRHSRSVRSRADRGHWSVKIDRSCWLALLVRGHYADRPEIIAAHSSPVMVDVKGSQIFAAADAVTILEQIEGATAYLDTIGTRAETERYKRMRLVLTAAHRKLHNRMHRAGHYHRHTPADDHAEHH